MTLPRTIVLVVCHIIDSLYKCMCITTSVKEKRKRSRHILDNIPVPGSRWIYALCVVFDIELSYAE